MYRKIFFLYFISFCLISCFPPHSGKIKTLSVSGTGTVSFIPDMVRMSINVKNVNIKLEDSLIQTKDTISKILDVCKKYNINDADIKTTYISTNKEYRWNSTGQIRVFDGYSASQNTEIVFRNLDRFEEFSADLLKLDITSVNNMVFDHSQRGKYEAEANLAALDNAKESAEKMAERMNVSLNGVIYIADLECAVYAGANYRDSVYAKSKSDAAGIKVSSGILSASRKVLVKYKIY